MSERAPIDLSPLDSSEPLTATLPSQETVSSFPLGEQSEPEPLTVPYGGVAIATEEPRFDPSRFSAAAYADQLMDELFGEIEQSLEPGGRSLAEPLRPTVQERSPEPPSQLVVAPIAEPAPDASITPIASEAELDSFFAETDTALTPTASETSQDAPASKSLDKLLVAIACTSLVIAGAIWLVVRHMGVPLASTDPAAAPAGQDAPTATANPEDAEFLSYLNKSLDAIARRTPQSQTPVAAANGELPAVPVNGDAPVGSPATTERREVYIPVYQVPQPGTAPTVSPDTLPNVAAVQPTLPPAAPLVPLPSVAPAAPPAVQNIAPASNPHLLVGLLEQGDRSLALFEANGTIQRVGIGEAIGSSGWTLVSVSASEAIVRRNGEVRSIYVGQQF